MFHAATTDLQHILVTYGYWAVFVFVAIESIGIPFPGETMLLVAAIDAGATHQLSIVLVIPVPVPQAWGQGCLLWALRRGVTCLGCLPGRREPDAMEPLFAVQRTWGNGLGHTLRAWGVLPRRGNPPLDGACRHCHHRAGGTDHHRVSHHCMAQ